MSEDSNRTSAHYAVEGPEDGRVVVRFKGPLNVRNAAAVLNEITPALSALSLTELVLDMARTGHFDDFGALVLLELRKLAEKASARFSVENAGQRVRDVLNMVNFERHEQCRPPSRKRGVNMVIRIGEATLREARNLKFLVSFIGSVILALVHVCLRPKTLRTDDTVTNMEKTGVDALPIVAMISFLLGLIMAFMSSIQFKQFGAGIYVASLVAFAMVSELGPIMTAIIVAGRSGSAYAAEIGTMKISEEIDALFTMGFDPVRFLAAPRVIAALLVVPLLYLFSNVFAIAGGLVVGVFMLDLTPNTYISQTIKALSLFDVAWGGMKAAVFAVLIACTGCLRGFQARGGASAVGEAATSAVVSSIFLIILFDSIFAVIRSYWK